MGGNALKEVTTRRYKYSEYISLCADVLNKLKAEFTDCECNVIKAYRSKESFGDMDVMLEVTPGYDYKEMIERLFSPNQIVKNGHVWSFDYKEFQIDLILLAYEIFDIAGIYFSYNDLGNFMGRIAKKMGFKYGHEGLMYVINDGDYQFAEIPVTTDHYKIFDFLGYDIERYFEGFNTMEDVFKFASSSPYFHKDIFLLHNRNHKARVRDAKRKSYHDFLEWMETAEGLPEYEWLSYESKGSYLTEEEHAPFLKKAFEMFIGFEDKYHKAMEEFQKNLDFKQKFNGALVMELTGLEGKELGQFMQFMRELSAGYQKEIILNLPDDMVNLYITVHFNIWNEQNS